MPGAFSSYDVKFTDTTKPDGQIWAGVVGNRPHRTRRGASATERWFVVWLGTAKDPIDQAAATALASRSGRGRPPPPPHAPPSRTPTPRHPIRTPPAPRPGVGVPVPVTTRCRR